MVERKMQQALLLHPWTSFFLVLLLLIDAITIFAAFRIQPSDARCDRHTYPWSPALDYVRYHWEAFENREFTMSTPYFGFVATDQIDDAWNELLPSTQYAQQEEPDLKTN